MESYESIFIIKPNDMAKVKETIERINNIIISEYCEIQKENDMGVRKLAYNIKGNSKRLLLCCNF